LEKEELMFSLDFQKMFTSVKREAVEKEIRKIFERQEIIRGWKRKKYWRI